MGNISERSVSHPHGREDDFLLCRRLRGAGSCVPVCLWNPPSTFPSHPFPLPPPRYPASDRQAGEIRPTSAPPRRPAPPCCAAAPHPPPGFAQRSSRLLGVGRGPGAARGSGATRSCCRCGYVGSARGILPAGAEQNSMGGAAAAAGPTPGGLRRLRLGLVGAGKDLVGAGRENVRDPPARRGVPGVGRGLALPPPPAGTLPKNEWGGRGHGGNFPTRFHSLAGRGGVL